MDCKHCNTPATQNYCPNCGQPTQLKRINGHYIVHEIEHVLHFERGILYTIKGLVTQPGILVRQFLSENRTRLVKPIIFIILTSLAYTVVNHYFHIEEAYLPADPNPQTYITILFKWIQEHYGYANILMGIFIAGWTQLFFRRYGYNFFEILILLCFIMGMGMLLFAVFALIQGLTKTDLMGAASLVTLAYFSWAIAQFFDKSKRLNYLKAFASYLLGMLTAIIFTVAVGLLLDTILKHP